MGYTTQFTGELKFAKELTASQLAAVKALCGEDCREHPEWNAKDLYCIDLELTDDFSGLKWDGTEKTYDMDKLVNVVITQMRKRWPDFALTGTLAAQGEDAMDRWTLVIGKQGLAEKRKVIIKGQKVRCPACDTTFILEENMEP